MTRNKARIIGGLFAGVLAAIATAVGFGACADAADDCHNTRSCPYPPQCIEAGDAADEIDGC